MISCLIQHELPVVVQVVLSDHLLSDPERIRLPDVHRPMCIGAEDDPVADLSCNPPEFRVRIIAVVRKAEEIDLERNVELLYFLTECAHFP